ncbi:protein kinase domain-containing protein [Streptomyces sp. NBC_01264]|uniref:protein kinase domain-containing protein n=1 Tax=Streptomyces sp. NBC_01264 TaxID=2903804 RepID=UPI002259EAB4|nr:protein kinase [Streptomyces sp. NBC_01264]MCX4779278.1 protein kinase [Streptomyces sp. NBC_01264]
MPETSWPDSRRIGPYLLLKRLGGGGMGDVYLGRSRGGRLVAVKVVRPHLANAPEFRRRFAVEVAAARQVGGFYTAMVVDADVTTDVPWLATAYVPGPSLQEAVDTHGPLPAGAVTALGAGLAEGLTAIHSHGLIHRDLKPGNVILAEDGPRIIDFGIARALDAATRLTAHGVIGTPAFMSPEQATDGEVGPPSDVFGLAGLLVHAVTGRTPFGGVGTFSVLHRIVHEEPDLTGVPPELARLLLPCLHKDPAQRPAAAKLLEWFAAAAESYAPTARQNPDQIATMIVERGALAATWVMEEPGGGPVPADERLRGALLGEIADAMGTLYARRASADRTVPVVLPSLPGEMAGADRVTVTRWHKRPGETVARGETLFSVTDGRLRAVVVSPAAGELREAGPAAGETVRVGDLVGVVRRPKAARPAAKSAKAPAKPKPRVGPMPTSMPGLGMPPRPALRFEPTPTPKPKNNNALSYLGVGAVLLFLFLYFLYSTVYSQDIFEAEVGDCVRIEGGGKGSAYVEPCEYQLPWGTEYKVMSVNGSSCLGGPVRSWTTDDKKKSITLCLQELNSLTGEPLT